MSGPMIIWHAMCFVDQTERRHVSVTDLERALTICVVQISRLRR